MVRKQTFLRSLLASLGKPVDTAEPDPGQRIRLSGRRLSLPLPLRPVEVELGTERLRVQKEIRCDGSAAAEPPDLIVFNPDLDSERVNYSLRIKAGQSLHISHDEPNQELLFRTPREAFRRNFYLDYDGENLVLRDPASELGTFITLLEEDIGQSSMVARRRHVMDEIIALYGGPLESMPSHEALDTVQQVNAILLNDAFRPKDVTGVAGGLLQLPTDITPVVIGDLHANMDNLLKILGENAFMWALKKKSAVLVFLGDLVQPDSEPYDDMDGSVLMMDFLLKLKLRFPDGVFFLRGNHDSFSLEAVKDQVPQGMLWRKKLEQVRGGDYCEQMARFYELSPVLALSEHFVACHAGPPFKKVDMNQIVNIRSFPDILHDLMWNRIRRPGYPSGYTASDVRRFRKSLNLGKELPYLVGHTPYSDTGTLWCDVGGVRHHHILYSAKKGECAVFIGINGRMVPQVYATEPILEWLNQRAESRARSA